MFFDPRKYDFSRVGRLKFNIKLYESQDATQLDKRTLTPEDFYGTIRYLLKLRKNIGTAGPAQRRHPPRGRKRFWGAPPPSVKRRKKKRGVVDDIDHLGNRRV